jgi:iron complex transport system ATP-binding protein
LNVSKHSLNVTDLAFAYDGHRVLKGVSLHLTPGEVLGLIGPNGAGKSTLIKLAAGLLCPTGGSVQLFGRPSMDWRQRDLARALAVVPQGAHLPPSFTVWESTLLGRTPHLGFLGMARERDRRVTRQVLEWVGIAHLADRRVGELSGGERQRVVLARALAQEPHCLLLDEPTTHLDIHHQVAILSLVRGLVDGRVVFQGTPAEVLRHEHLAAIYGDSVTIFPRPDGGSRPGVLPRCVEINP